MDLILLAYLRKYVGKIMESSSYSTVKNVKYDNDTSKLVFTLSDGTVQSVAIPFQAYDDTEVQNLITEIQQEIDNGLYDMSVDEEEHMLILEER